jgi:hypothetical protein
MTGAGTHAWLVMRQTREESGDMSEQGQTKAAVEALVGQPAVGTPTATRQQPAVISDPREIAAVVMARMNLINAKKDELSIAIKGLTDLTQQLVRAYAGQMQVIEQIATRLKALEEKTSSNGVHGHAAAPDTHSA